jgi:hypothetical protein
VRVQSSVSADPESGVPLGLEGGRSLRGALQILKISMTVIVSLGIFSSAYSRRHHHQIPDHKRKRAAWGSFMRTGLAGNHKRQKTGVVCPASLSYASGSGRSPSFSGGKCFDVSEPD